MTDRIQLQPAQAFATCAQLPGRETNLVRHELLNASGGWGANGLIIGPVIIGRLIAEAIVDYFDD